MGGLVKGGPVRAAQVKIAELEAELAQYRANFNAFRVLLHSAKFTGTDRDGERKDWIATADVLCWLNDTERDALQAAAEVKQCPACGRPFTGAACSCTKAQEPSDRICPDCGIRELDADGWCSKCGHPDNGPKPGACPRCGADMRGAQVCAKCTPRDVNPSGRAGSSQWEIGR